MKNKIFLPVIIALSLIITVCNCVVFDKLIAYKQEIQRLHDLQNNRIWKLMEDNSIQFNRLNELESILQSMTETVDRLDWLSRHKY